MKKSTKVKKTKVSKPVALTKKLKKFNDGGAKGIGTLKPKTAVEAAKDLKINPTIATAETLEQQTASSENLMKGLMRPPTKEKETVVESPKTKKIAGGFSSETQKVAYIKNAKDMIAKGKTVDDLVKSRFGTKEGLAALGIKDNAKPKTPVKPKSGTKTQLKVERNNGTTTMTRTTKRTTVVPKNAIASRVAMQGVTEKLPSSSKVPLKNNTNKKMTSSELKQKGLEMKKQGQNLKQKGSALKEKAGDKQYWKSKYYQDLVSKAASGKNLSTKERDLVWDKTTKKRDYGQKVSDKENMARNKILKGATDKGRETFTDFATGVASVVLPGVAGKALGKGVKMLRAAKAAKVLKVDKIIKPITKAIPRSTNAGKTIKINGRTVSEGSQKLLGSGQKALGNGQKLLGNTKGLPAPKKGLPAPKLSSKISKESASKAISARSNRALARGNRSAKIEASIKTNNPVARQMVRTRKTNELVKKGTAKIKQTLKNNKIKNTPPKPGDQLKLNLRKGGKIRSMRKGGKK